ncbi:MAG: ATP-binding cassette domain-containing protein [Bacteroidales bacterium]|nr:ATP-binding cassette domain-containing protein [Bacteroidales bacterium]
MFKIELYSIAFDILVETTVNHHKQRETLSFLKKTAFKLDSIFDVKTFSSELKSRIDFYVNQLQLEDELLFISESHIPYHIKQKNLVLNREKFQIYLIIKGWVDEFDFPNSVIYYKLGEAFKLEYKSIQQTNLLFDTPEYIHGNSNFMKLTPTSPDETEKLEGEWVNTNKPANAPRENEVFMEKIDHEIDTAFFADYTCFVLKCKQRKKVYKNNILCPDIFCLLEPGDTLTVDEKTRISFADLKRKFVENKYTSKFYLTAQGVELRFQKKEINSFNFIGQPGELIGVVGNEGSGKSTILQLLAGFKAPTKGKISVNGYDLQKNKFQLSGIIGYVPEEDLLFYELTVKENLEFAAALYLRSKTKSEIRVLIDKILHQLDLYSLKDKIVGKPGLKYIQPGQRKLLNIALELIREPKILIIDNSISPLSLGDSSRIINILSNLTLEGKLIITSITQVPGETFELFDNLFVLTDDGTPVYYGPRSNAYHYFIKKLPPGLQNKYDCKNSCSSGQLVEMLNEPEPMQENKVAIHKVINQEILHSAHLEKTREKVAGLKKKKKIPGNQNPPPRLETQYLFYTLRNLKTKLANKRNLLFIFLSVPLIGLILALLLRTAEATSYIYSLNDNIPTFFYLSILINFFNGLAQTVNEIFREKHVLKKEEFIHLSRFSYINGKVTLSFIILFGQTALFTQLTNFVLEIQGFFLYDWLTYFSIGAIGALFGLVFSATHSIYDNIVLKSVPILLFLILVFGGGLINFNNINHSNEKYTPWISEFMVSKWGYEALMVNHYNKNLYQRNFSEPEKLISAGTFNSYNIIPKLKEYFEYLTENQLKNTDSVNQVKKILQNQFKFYAITEDVYEYEYLEELLELDLNEAIISETNDYLSYLDYYFYKMYNAGYKQKQVITDSLISLYGENYINGLKTLHHNSSIIQKVRNTSNRTNFILRNYTYIQLSDPVYQTPHNNLGRTKLFLSQKRFNNQVVDTYLFNISIIWLMSFLLYILLITNLLNVRFLQ